MLYTATELREWDCDTEIKGKWIPARPLRCDSFFKKLKISWFVFKGKYDALDWQDENCDHKSS